MSTQKVSGDTRTRSVKVENLRSFANVRVFEEDEENAQINEECTGRFKKILSSRVKPNLVVVASDDDAATEAEAAAAVDARRKQLFEQFDKEREHKSGDVNIHNRSKQFPSPNVEKGMEPSLESTPYEEVSEEHGEDMSESTIPAQGREHLPHVIELSLLPHYLTSAFGDGGISVESEFDRLSRQVQVLVHQLTGCRQNLLRAEIEVGVLHEENRELRCLIKDLLAAYSRP